MTTREAARQVLFGKLCLLFGEVMVGTVQFEDLTLDQCMNTSRFIATMFEQMMEEYDATK